ncbi:ATP-dependent Clp protease proteolytic subunit [Massilia endophytica]|uniref:ATP-dependent Clp protease proteolytic subunit n=1 Tax=Massilia endophytica TaxID=2899220 RepID=UPI001E3C7280|nr:ATP-dependent Clp protease proteolytic subunit [Massilia endophytica]UGQ45438.1 ATP-dependent Clp protease proteolytic subunit [Massilia endophytica]
MVDVHQSDVEDRTANWNRCIYVDQTIDEELVRILTPQILRLRSESSQPITIAINSAGGSISAMETLVGLLTGPDQDGIEGKTVAVVTERAYSAAAVLLASSSYSVALPHTDILFHDVRYGGMEDVTPASAKVAVSQLQEINETFSLQLADQIFSRLVWNYIHFIGDFEGIVAQNDKVHSQFAKTIAACKAVYDGENGVDLASFATCLWVNVSRENECLVLNAMRHLHNWGIMTNLAKSFPDYRQKGRHSRPGLLDGPKKLFETISRATKIADSSDVWSASEADMKLVISLLVANATRANVGRPMPMAKLLDVVSDDFKMIRSIDDPRHLRSTIGFLTKHKEIFFSGDALRALNGKDEEAKRHALARALPSGKMFWQFCVLLCRELFNGEHKITPTDAQVLGLIDEVPGENVVESLRDWLKSKLQPPQVKRGRRKVNEA